MELILGFGANLDGGWGTPEEAICEGVRRLPRIGLPVKALSRLYSTRAMGPKQPDFVNAVAICTTRLSPYAAFRKVKGLELLAGRQDGERWSARVLDIDLLDFEGRVGRFGPGGRLVLPHIGLHLRDFVLRPLLDVAPDWCHPISGRSALNLLKDLPAEECYVRGRL